MNIIACARSKNPIYHCQSHIQYTWEIILNLTGNVTSVIDGKTYNIIPGDILVIPPDTPHDGTSENGYSDIFLACNDTPFSEVMHLHDNDESVLNLMNMLHKVLLEKEHGYKEIAEDLFHTICSYLKKYNNCISNYKFVNDLKNKIYDNLSNSEFNILEYVHKTGYNINYVRRCFKAETGKTPLEYMTDMRLRYAKKLLVQANYISVVDVAEKCGFNDSFYFSKLFKRQYGVSPLAYRKQKML